MGLLILHPTDLGQWHALLSEAQASSNVILSENTESYLVFLLMRFAKEQALVESVLALDFLQSEHDPSVHQRLAFLQSIGDKSLLYCGLFPGMATKRHVSLSYFADLGQQAYFNVSLLYAGARAPLFAELSERFNTLQQVLQATYLAK